MSNPIDIKAFSLKYNIETLIDAVIAATAATISVMFDVPPWVMFVGWLAYSASGKNLKEAIFSPLRVFFGFGVAITAFAALQALTPYVGAGALAIVVCGAAIVVLTVRCLPVVGNPTACFLGLVTYFASQPDLTLPVVGPILAIVAFGSFSGFLAFQLGMKLKK